jgi:hypothetical protein
LKNKAKRAGGMGQEEELLLSKHKALSSNPLPRKQNKTKNPSILREPNVSEEEELTKHKVFLQSTKQI